MMQGFFGRGGEDQGALPSASPSTEAGQGVQEAQKINDFCWVNLPPNPVVRVIMGFFGRGEMLKAVQVCKSWNSVLLLDEVCEDLATGVTIFRGLSSHVKNVHWRDPHRSYSSFLLGYHRAVRRGRDLERWWTRYKVTFCLSIPPLVGRGGPATCWSVEDCTWRWESGLLKGGFSYNVQGFSVNNWLSIPMHSGPMERLITSPDTSFFTEATLIDKETGRFAKLFGCSDRDVALGRQVSIETMAANNNVSAVHITEALKRLPSRHVRGVRVRLRYSFTAYDWTEDSVRLKCTACSLDLEGIEYEAATQGTRATLIEGQGEGEGGAEWGEEEGEEGQPPAWVLLKRCVEGLTWVA